MATAAPADSRMATGHNKEDGKGEEKEDEHEKEEEEEDVSGRRVVICRQRHLLSMKFSHIFLCFCRLDRSNTPTK